MMHKIFKVSDFSRMKSGEIQNYLGFPAKELLGETKHRNENEHHDIYTHAWIPKESLRFNE